MLVRFYNIEWENDVLTDAYFFSYLPEEFEIAVNDDFDVEEYGTELLGHHFGSTVESCQWEIVIPSEEEVYDQ